jgi:uncharacterized protein (DUF58 family)
MRRVHWRATAHHDELMVRREEQPWQSRATLLLDTRSAGHTGEGADSSLEWAVTATASIGVHLAGRGYAVRLLTDSGAALSTSWHDPASGPTGAQTPLLDALAVVTARRDASVGQWPELLAGAHAASGLLIGVFGRLSPAEARVTAGLRHGSTAALAVLLDVASWTSLADSQVEKVRLTETRQALRRAGWSVIVARRGDHVAGLGEQLGLQRVHVSEPEPASTPAGAA